MRLWKGRLRRVQLFCRKLLDESFGMVRAPCNYSDEYGVIPTLVTEDYTQSMQVSLEALNGVPDSKKKLLGAILTNVDAKDDKVIPVAFLMQWKEVLEDESCVVDGKDISDGTSSRHFKLGWKCGMLEGG